MYESRSGSRRAMTSVRDRQLNVRLTEEESVHVTELAEARGVSEQVYIRMMLRAAWMEYEVLRSKVRIND